MGVIMNKIFCDDCIKFAGAYIFNSIVYKVGGCNHILRCEDTPVRQKPIYGESAVLNKDNNCEHFVGKVTIEDDIKRAKSKSWLRMIFQR
jgi:hypothetical protein